MENLARNSYDELGQLTVKKVGGQNPSGLQQVDYQYNIRGWMTRINNPENLNPHGHLWTCSPSGLTTTSPSLKVPSRHCTMEISQKPSGGLLPMITKGSMYTDTIT